MFVSSRGMTNRTYFALYAHVLMFAAVPDRHIEARGVGAGLLRKWYAGVVGWCLVLDRNVNIFRALCKAA